MEGIFQHSQILVVEDEQNTSALIKSIFEETHFKAHVFEDPLLALDVFRDDPIGYNLVMCDVTIKHMSAFEFLRQAREENPDIKFLLITTIEIKSTEFRKVLPTVSIDGFIEKQSLSNKLIPTINKILVPRKIAKSNIDKYR